MKKHLITIILFFVLLAGLSLVLYPSFSNWWNSIHMSRVITDYVNLIDDLEEDEYAELLEAAHAYNRSLANRENGYLLTDEQKDKYNDLLNIAGNGVMGYVEIPTIGVNLPIYHGTGDDVLQVAIGHLDWSSLPVGGESTHSVISGHRGLPSAQLFTHLDKVRAGDIFVFPVLNEVMTYELDQILIVEPRQVESLLISQGEDLCTMFTCTPYGINTHRLLVRGHRVANEEEAEVRHVISEAVLIEPAVVAPIVALPMLFVLFIWIMIPKKKRKWRDEW